MNKLNFIDVFCGAGGLSCGMELAGMRCVLGVDHNKHAMETFALNHKHAKTYCGDITKLTKKEILELIGENEIHAVVGGPPCQGFSTVGPGNPNDTRNRLFLEFLRIVKVTNPQFVVIENVTGLLAKKNADTVKAIFRQFGQMGFNMSIQVLSSQNFGVPEFRRRTIIIGSRVNEAILFPRPTHDTIIAKTYRGPSTVGAALENISCKNGSTLNHDLHLANISSPIDKKRLARIPEGKGIRYENDEKAYLPKSLKLGIDWEKLRENRFRQTKFQRLDRSRPSPTIMTHRHSYYHPTEDRYLTQREAAAIQSFPNDFEFRGPLSAQWRQIGNAVPPLLGKAIGKQILVMFKNREIKGRKFKAPTLTIHSTIRNERERAFIYKKKGIEIAESAPTL